MSKKFSKYWIGSKSPKKQRKYRLNAPLHLKRPMLSVHLTKDLRKTYNTRNLPVKKGDTVIVMRGKYKGQESKVDKVYTKQLKVSLEGIKGVTKKGNKVPFKLRPSALMLKELNLADNWRMERLKEYVKTR